jgi:hypothetical protein
MMISIAGREIDEEDEQAEALLKQAHERKSRPLCLCRSPIGNFRSPISASIIS